MELRWHVQEGSGGITNIECRVGDKELVDASVAVHFCKSHVVAL